MPLRNKYPISNWVLSQDNLKPGDSVAFYCEETQQEVHAKVLGFPSTEHRQYITCQRENADCSEVVNFYNTIVYRLNDETPPPLRTCTCGAKFTSNPKYHLPYCELSEA